MHKQIRGIITMLAALSVSGLAVAMAWASAMQRATTRQDQLLMAALGVAVMLAVHLLPALLRRRQRLVMWPVWLMCFALAGYGHASWFYLAGESAASARHAGSAAVAAAAHERAAIEQTLSTIKARPVAAVAAQLARTSDSDRREALATELAESRRAAGLRDRLISLAGNTVPRWGTSGNDQGTAGSARGTWPSTDMTMVMSVAAAVLVELLGSLLWAAALGGDDETQEVAHDKSGPSQTIVQQVVNLVASPLAPSLQVAAVDVVDELDDLRAAISRGDCKLTVRSIKDYMGCKTDTAARLRRALEVTP